MLGFQKKAATKYTLHEKGMRPEKMILPLMVGVSLFFSASAFSTAEKPQAEILHWWSSEGESAALQVFIDEFESRGGHYFDSTKDNQNASRSEAIDRLSKGYPSTFTQWNAGRDIREFYEFGLIDAIADPEIVAHFKSTLPKPVLDAVSADDEVLAVPLNLHSENWMWYSNELLQAADQLLSDDWSGFLAAGKSLAGKKIPLIAVGNQPWQVRILFTSVFLGISREAYKTFYLGAEPDIVAGENFQTTLSVFSKLASYSKSFGSGDWNLQVRAVSDGLAASTFMGDWAKGELLTLGKEPGRDYGCILTAGNDPSLLMVIDSLILGKVTDPLEKQGQSLMLEVVSNPQTNLAFNKLKGSVSPYAMPDTVDACSKQVYALLEKDDAVMPPYAAYGGKTNHIDSIDRTIYELWDKSVQGHNRAELIENASNKFRQILTEKRQTNQRPQATLTD